MTTIQFEVSGIPVAQPRQRQRVVTAHGKTFAANYTPTTHPVNTWKAAIQIAFRQVYQGPPLDEPVVLLATLVFPRPKNRIWKTRPMAREPKTSKPDGDNCLKALQDALNGIAWRDDAIVFDVHMVRYIASGDESAHSEITIQTLPPSEPAPREATHVLQPADLFSRVA